MQKSEDLERRLQAQSLVLAFMEAEMEDQEKDIARAEQEAKELAACLKEERERRQEADTNQAWAWALLAGVEETLRASLEVCQSAHILEGDKKADALPSPSLEFGYDTDMAPDEQYPQATPPAADVLSTSAYTAADRVQPTAAVADSSLPVLTFQHATENTIGVSLLDPEPTPAAKNTSAFMACAAFTDPCSQRPIPVAALQPARLQEPRDISSTKCQLQQNSAAAVGSSPLDYTAATHLCMSPCPISAPGLQPALQHEEFRGTGPGRTENAQLQNLVSSASPFKISGSRGSTEAAMAMKPAASGAHPHTHARAVRNCSFCSPGCISAARFPLEAEHERRVSCLVPSESPPPQRSGTADMHTTDATTSRLLDGNNDMVATGPPATLALPASPHAKPRKDAPPLLDSVPPIMSRHGFGDALAYGMLNQPLMLPAAAASAPTDNAAQQYHPSLATGVQPVGHECEYDGTNLEGMVPPDTPAVRLPVARARDAKPGAVAHGCSPPIMAGLGGGSAPGTVGMLAPLLMLAEADNSPPKVRSPFGKCSASGSSCQQVQQPQATKRACREVAERPQHQHWARMNGNAGEAPVTVPIPDWAAAPCTPANSIEFAPMLQSPGDGISVQQRA